MKQVFTKEISVNSIPFVFLVQNANVLNCTVLKPIDWISIVRENVTIAKPNVVFQGGNFSRVQGKFSKARKRERTRALESLISRKLNFQDKRKTKLT